MLSLWFRSQYGPGQKEETDQPHALEVKYPQGLGQDPSGGLVKGQAAAIPACTGRIVDHVIVADQPLPGKGRDHPVGAGVVGQRRAGQGQGAQGQQA